MEKERKLPRLQIGKKSNPNLAIFQMTLDVVQKLQDLNERKEKPRANEYKWISKRALNALDKLEKQSSNDSELLSIIEFAKELSHKIYEKNQ